VPPVSKEDLDYAKLEFKKARDASVERKKTTVFKEVVRSKGFMWLSNKPETFFEWQ
jgi:G3E family GTPase